MLCYFKSNSVDHGAVPYLGSPAPHSDISNSFPYHVMWDPWWTDWLWGRFSLSILVAPAKSHSNSCSMYIAILSLMLYSFGIDSVVK